MFGLFRFIDRLLPHHAMPHFQTMSDPRRDIRASLSEPRAHGSRVRILLTCLLRVLRPDLRSGACLGALILISPRSIFLQRGGGREFLCAWLTGRDVLITLKNLSSRGIIDRPRLFSLLAIYASATVTDRPSGSSSRRRGRIRNKPPRPIKAMPADGSGIAEICSSKLITSDCPG